MDRKELALALHFNKAPKEIQEAIRIKSALAIKIDKNMAQIQKERSEHEELTRAFNEADKELKKLLKAWDPAEAEGV